jgi:hypothetical protein
LSAGAACRLFDSRAAKRMSSEGRVMKSRMAGVIAFFILAALWAATILTVQAMQAIHYR